MARLFVCAWPDPAAVAALHQVAQRCGGGALPGPEDRWHLTLCFIGEADPGPAAASLAAASLPSVTAWIQPSPIRIGRNLMAAAVTGVEPLAEAVERAVADHSRTPVDDPRFVGHVTLAKRRSGIERRGAGPDRVSPSDSTRPHPWAIDAVALVHSTLTASGPVYRTLVTMATVSAGGR